MEAATFPEEKIDVLIMECTRGDHPKPAGWTRASEERRLAEAIGAAFERRSCVLIPVFALGKTQEILAMLYKFRRERLLPEFPIYIGGLSSKMTDIYDRRAHMTRRQLPRLQLMREAAPFILNEETVRDAPLRPGRLYAALQRDDDTKNTLQCSCAAADREPAAFDLFCRLCQPGIACRSSTGRENKWGGYP